jgi:hypothetical protein
MPNKIKAETKFSHFEYDGWFLDPLFEPLRLYGVLSSVYAELKPFNITPGDVKYQGGASTPSDALVIFNLAKNQYALNLSMAGLTFKADAVDWSQAPIITNIIETTSKALTTNLKTELKSHQLQIVMQLVLPGVSLKDFSKSFAPLTMRPAGDTEFNGIVLRTRRGFFLVDKSELYEGGIFVRITQKFEGKTDVNEMAKALNDEESWLAAALGIEIT